MKITYHGHSVVHVETEQASILIDPFITGNPLAKISANDVKADYILLTHGHGDHVGDTVELAKRHNATVIAPNELAVYLSWKGCNTHPMHIGGAREFEFGKVKFTQAFHGSAVVDEEGQNIIYTGMPAGILLTVEGKTIYHAGDTALFGDMKLLGELHSIDLAFLPIGDNFTMGPEDALLAAEWVKANKVIPMHYNTFPPIEQDPHQFVQQLKAKGIEGQVLESTESITL
ncbi:metal-dependent hydrolase [Bacillus horti]|uniref:UPF0173 metal-dependent hydrolase J2S11_003913 n=1 Tax=Caldalkalibacillus horti TaxID=77523 RepID=A0ABT9W3Z7_9BACI|nr:metal-dependent hydrolase [Bacillus horti]MDQ0167983.1 L-ascorbate metabolism protein UlaG (beta-lactamase superfamily) [Bacillus horti]